MNGADSLGLATWWSEQISALTLFGLNFGHPESLALLALLPLWFLWQRKRESQRRTIPFSRAAVLAAGPRPSLRWVKWLPWLRMLAIAGVILAVAQPRSGARAERVNSDGIDIALTVDISSSMLAEDFQPQNRMEVAREKLKRFVLGRKTDRVGLIAFSGEALTQVPLTTDYPVVLAAIDNLQVGQLEDGTAIGTAIATAANRLRNSPGRSRVMVLLTDGENNRGAIDPRTAAQAAGTFGIRIYTIGVGSEGMAPVPVGRGLFGLRYENRPVKIDEPLLTEIASSTGGRYFRAKDAAALQAIYEQIDQLERSAVEAKAFIRYTERFRWPLLFGLAALCAELWLRARRGVLP
ncbi:VWA domain-containing protein [Gemmatimonas phototrophica]|uniref:VWA domain-containing protein n=1 Tax=Gemmatimonas phototrophica TaxID=1379270 RepID=UPI0006A75675|nr:VWA domain-containing protein [Gemmatimonas phototrophica]